MIFIRYGDYDVKDASDSSGAFFYPDAQHQWDGKTLP